MRAICFLPILMTVLPSSLLSSQCTTNYEIVLSPSNHSASSRAESSRPQFKCYAETALGTETKAVVFSEKTSSGSLDAVYKVKLALVSGSAGRLRAVVMQDITGSIPVQLEIPGNFYEMNAIAETLVAHNKVQLLHINVWAVLSGSGHISGANDLFYKYELGQLSKLLLEIHKSSTFSKENINNMSEKTSELF